MKDNCFSIFFLWKKYKILFCMNLSVILMPAFTLELSAAGSVDGKSISTDNTLRITASETGDQSIKSISSRVTLSLDGEWQVAEGRGDAPPTTFGRTMQVPGLVDQPRNRTF